MPHPLPVNQPVAAMSPGGLLVVCMATIAAIGALYVPQPLYHVLQGAFGIGRPVAALAVTATMLPLAVAPVAYGLLLERVPAGRMARLAVLVVGLGHFLLPLAPNWTVFLAIRLVQGLALPAALTGFMTLLARGSGADRVQRVLSVYIAATIVGGFSGRFFSGLVSHFLGWQASFLILGGVTLIAWAGLLTLKGEGRAASWGRPRLGHVLEVLRRPYALRAYLIPFCAFFTFTGVLNFLPFRLAELLGQASELRVGVMYAGYLVGVLTSLASARVVRRLGGAGKGSGEARAILLGLVLFLLSVAACAWPNAWGLFAMLFPFCAGFFLVQSVGPGLVNRLGSGHEGLTNGLYIATYYGGGACGSILPGLAYVAWGWTPFLGVVLAVLAVGMIGCASMVIQGKRESGQ